MKTRKALVKSMFNLISQECQPNEASSKKLFDIPQKHVFT